MKNAKATVKGPKNAIPTLKGWVSPKGELLKAQKITQAQIDEWYGNLQPAPKIEEVVDVVYNTPVVEEVVEEESNDIDYEAMTRAELLEIAEASGIVVPGFRPSKKAIIDALEDLD